MDIKVCDVSRELNKAFGISTYTYNGATKDNFSESLIWGSKSVSSEATP